MIRGECLVARPPLTHMNPVLLLFLLPLYANAFSFPSPFKKARFSENGLVFAGPLGLHDLAGKVAAVGDWDGDQLFVPPSFLFLSIQSEDGPLSCSLDLFTLSDNQKEISVWLWNHRPSISRSLTKLNPHTDLTLLLS